MMEDFLTERGGVDVGVYFGGADRLVTEHRLDGTQVGTALEKSRGKGMAQGVGRDGLLDSGILRHLLNHDENHRARKSGTATVHSSPGLIVI